MEKGFNIRTEDKNNFYSKSIHKSNISHTNLDINKFGFIIEDINYLNNKEKAF